MLQIVVHGVECNRIAVGTWISEDGIVIANHHKIHPPGVDANRGDFKPPLSHLFQTTDDLEIQGIDVPIEMAALFNEVIGEAGYFVQM